MPAAGKATASDRPGRSAAALNNPGEPGFSEPPTAQREALPAFGLADLAGLHVTVVPKAVEVTGASGGLNQQDFQIDVGVQRKTGSELEADRGAPCPIRSPVRHWTAIVRFGPYAGLAGPPAPAAGPCPRRAGEVS
jgi:hypothetical protein